MKRPGTTPALLLMVMAAALSPHRAHAASSADPSNELAEEAIARNPGLRALEQQIVALRHRTEAATVWMDPTLAVEYSNVPWDSWALDDSPMTGIQLRLQQTFPFPGKNERREAEADRAVEVKRWELAEKRLQLRGMVRRTFWRLALTRQLQGLTQEHVALVEQLLSAVRSKYEVGRGAQHDVLRLEVLRDRLRDDLKDFVRDARRLVAAINAALHREVTLTIETPAQTELTPPRAQLAALVDTALSRRPLLSLWRSKAAKARTSAERAAHERWPDVSAWAGWRFRHEAGPDGGVDFFSLGVSIPLPFDYTDRWEATKSAHLSDASAADAAWEAEADALRAELEDALATWSRGAQMAKTYETELIPQARATLDATTNAYQTDRADFASLFQAELQLLDFERTVRRARFAATDAAIRVETATGGGIDEVKE